MENLTVVKIINTRNYKSLNQEYGILVQPMENTTIVNLDSNRSGLCISIANKDYAIVSPSYWKNVDGEVVVRANGGYVHTGLKIWE